MENRNPESTDRIGVGSDDLPIQNGKNQFHVGGFPHIRGLDPVAMPEYTSSSFLLGTPRLLMWPVLVTVS